ncbi:transposase family protein [Persicitalea sp.]|uniref:transposase family protein n=1 Tax=Persicitalea sp. TaxID=3100273 RepID=UPI003594512A
MDSGYQGFAKDYKCRQVYLPVKAHKKHPLTEEQKLSNRELASQRIGVEPLRRTDSIGRTKRYRIASDRLRMRDFVRYDDTLEVCAGLWNFYAMS